ncbi:hypothetical protein MAM1_0017c01565 [Mucor ambiguus]|uniref:Uncharacterized protein n=1 Tax=Mucor ambiguus TaxID=91626 RepID=A0A0C9LRF5_9FUNG|nr:hypothetical protein MAM1_0017c01565 [Mucor ambiguus]
MSRIDISEENLKCHHILFIKDVKESAFIHNRSCYKTRNTNLSYRFARLNGVIVVTQKSSLSNRNEDYIWLDDGTDVIRVVLPQAILSRKNVYLVEKGASVTVFGSVQTLDGDEIILRCNGFKVDEDGGALSEIYHWLKAVENRPRNVSSQRNMFYSVSSAPSPNRLLKENFMVSPLRDFTADNTKYLWSPDHVFATSTPLRLIRENETVAVAAIDDNDEDFDDEFDTFGDDIDLAAVEAAALQRLEQQQQPNKRRYSLSMD